MPKFITLQINEPCHENWDNMNPNEQGKYCNSCKKSVVDFTTMTDTQVANYFKLNPGNTCGRFYDDQLNHTIALPRKEIPWLKYFFTITLPAFLFSLKATAQKKVDSKKTELTSPKMNTFNNSYMNGGYKIYDSTSLKDTTKYKKGEVWIKPENDNNLKIENLPEVKVYSSSTIICRRETMGLYATVISKKKKSNPKKDSIIEKKIKKNSDLILYPNPVLSNTTLNISFSNEILGEIVLEIFNANGNLVKKEERIIEFKTKHNYINTLNLVKGFYICRVTNKNTNEIFSKEFLVQ